MAREKGMGNLQQEKSGRWTLRIGYNGKRISRSTGTRDRDKAEKMLMRILAPLGRGEKHLPLADVWCAYLRSPNRRDLAQATLESKQMAWMHFARWMENAHIEIGSLAEVTAESVAEYLAEFKFSHTATTYNNRVCILREIFHVLADKAGLVDDPWFGVRLRPDDCHTRRELTLDELRRLLAAAKKRDEVSGIRYQEDGRARRSATAACGETICVQNLPSDPCSLIPDPSLPHPSSLIPDTSSHEWHTLFLIGIYTGLRLGDCCQLKWDNINLERGIIQVIPSKTAKHAHGHPVTIPIHPVLETALRSASSRDQVSGARDQEEGRACRPATAAMDTTATGSSRADGGIPPGVGTPSRSQFACAEGTCVQNSPHVLPTIAATYRTSRWRVSETIARIFKAANIEMHTKVEGRARLATEASFHSLRHTFVSFAANAGVPLAVVQSIVGHSTALMTRHYYHESESALKAAVAAIPSL